MVNNSESLYHQPPLPLPICAPLNILYVLNLLEIHRRHRYEGGLNNVESSAKMFILIFGLSFHVLCEIFEYYSLEVW